MVETSKNKQTETIILVKIYYLGIEMGVFRAKNIKFYGLLLEPGPVSFPVGSNITIEFRSRDKKPRFSLDATVVRKVEHGMKVVFDNTPDMTNSRDKRYVNKLKLTYDKPATVTRLFPGKH
ncbi:MAG: hypothetical protein PVG75_08025 [Thioalkalispiraceae bacterium]